MKNILILNGSPNGKTGNCQRLIQRILRSIGKSNSVNVVHLSESSYSKSLLQKLKKADAVIFVTGTYWDSWGSPLQKFLEDATELEGSEILVGKPCATFVLMHSVGGKGVLSRLQGVLSSLGFLIPPMSGMVYSLVSDLALKNSQSTHAKDFWCLEDIDRILENLKRSLEIKVNWISWPVDEKSFRKTWLK